jgi:hypothetical protein
VSTRVACESPSLCQWLGASSALSDCKSICPELPFDECCPESPHGAVVLDLGMAIGVAVVTGLCELAISVGQGSCPNHHSSATVGSPPLRNSRASRRLPLVKRSGEQQFGRLPLLEMRISIS